MLYAVEEFCNCIVKSLNEITKEDIKTYAKYLSTRPNRRRSGGLSSSIIRHYLYGLQVFFGWCEQTGRLHKNPMSGYQLPQVERVKRVILSRTEVGRLYEVCEHYEEEALLGIYYGCGLRRSEGEALDLRDIDFVKSLLYVRSGKGGKRRVVPLGKRVKQDLLNYVRNERPDLEAMSSRQNSRAFMLNYYGGRMSGDKANQRLKGLVKKAGLLKQISLHSLRHSIATHLLMNGLSLEQVRDFLGHANLETTQIYLHEIIGTIS